MSEGEGEGGFLVFAFFLGLGAAAGVIVTIIVAGNRMSSIEDDVSHTQTQVAGLQCKAAPSELDCLKTQVASR